MGIEAEVEEAELKGLVSTIEDDEITKIVHVAEVDELELVLVANENDDELSVAIERADAGKHLQKIHEVSIIGSVSEVESRETCFLSRV